MSGDNEKAQRILGAVVERSYLYGLVSSGEVIFVIDTSGSMEARFTSDQGETPTRLRKGV